MASKIDICSRCIMTPLVDPDIVFKDGVCNHCFRYDALISARVPPAHLRAELLETIVTSIKRAGRKREYDCIIGVSGGVDSTFVALKVHELGLRPLAVHVDNSWNSELAVSNIERTLGQLGLDLKTEVLNVAEFYDLQKAFLLASTPDADIPTDHAIQAVLWKYARDHGVKYIISGMNFATESINVRSWSYGHSDWRYIKDVHRQFGSKALRSYPHFGFLTLFWTSFVRRVKSVSILNYMDYNKNDAMTELTRRLDWRPYDGKHFESVYTRWIQGYLLPVKFHIDKRRGHLSDLINSGQLTRDAALTLIEERDYPEELRQQDEAFLKKKLSLTTLELEQILRTPPRTFENFRNSYRFVQALRWLVNVLRKQGLYPR